MIARRKKPRGTEDSQGRPRLSVEGLGNESSVVVVGHRGTKDRSYDRGSVMRFDRLGLWPSVAETRDKIQWES